MESRSLEVNRHLARKRMSEMVEWHVHGMESRRGREIMRLKRNNSRERKRSLDKYAGLAGQQTATVMGDEEKRRSKLDPKFLFHLDDNDIDVNSVDKAELKDDKDGKKS